MSPSARVPDACCGFPQWDAGILPSSTEQGEFFKTSLISETIGGWEAEKTKVAQRLRMASHPVKTVAVSLKNA